MSKTRRKARYYVVHEHGLTYDQVLSREFTSAGVAFLNLAYWLDAGRDRDQGAYCSENCFVIRAEVLPRKKKGASKP